MIRPKKRVTITLEMARDIRKAYAAGNVSQHTLARQFNVSQASVSRAVLGNWNIRGNPKNAEISKEAKAKKAADLAEAISWLVGTVRKGRGEKL
jgi:predicted transcriptional regulator